MIYTSYFAIAKYLPKKIVPISIALHPPKGYRGWRLSQLAPTQAILDRWKASPHGKTGTSKDDTSPYAQEYRTEYVKTVLARYDPERLAKKFADDFPGQDVCLLCYEKPDDFCHRHLVADWFNAAGIAAEEWVRKDTKEDQISLFKEE